MTSSADVDLLHRARTGDGEALDLLWRAHRGWVAAVLLAHLPAGAEVDDLLQDVAVALVAGIGGVREPAGFRAWLRTVAVNAARSALRSHRTRRHRGPVGGLVAEAVPDPRPDDGGVRERLRETLARVAELPLELREPLLLRAVEGLSQRGIAEVLGVPETTVEARLARARRRLRRAVDFGVEVGRGAAAAVWKRRQLP